MPSALEYRPPNHPERRKDMMFDSERADRKRKFDKAWEYYIGNHKRHLRNKEGEPDDNTTINLVKLSADRTVSFLFPEVPKFEIDENTTEETNDEVWLRQLFEENGGLGFLQRVGLIGYLSGHVYIRIRPPKKDVLRPSFPRLQLIHPNQAVTYWQSGDYTEVLWHEITWQTGDTEFMLDVIKREAGWELIEYSKARGGTWTPTGKADQWRYPYPPIVDWQHLPNPTGYYGIDEAESITLQDTINLIISEMNRIIRYHATPRTVATGVMSEDIRETGIDSLWAIEDPDARVNNLEMESDLVASREILTYLQDMYLALKRVVILRGDVKDFQRVTNAGVRTVFMDMLAKRRVLLAQYNRGLRNLCSVASMTVGKNLFPTIVGANPLPIDEREQVQLTALKLDKKMISHETATTETGHNWQDELAKMEAEQEIEFLYPAPLNLTNSSPNYSDDEPREEPEE